MKIRRHRKVRQYLNFYKNNFSFRTPYQVLIDSSFCHWALQCKLNIQEQMPKYLESEVKLFTTVCVIEETALIGSAVYGALQIVKQFPLRKCGHEKNPQPAVDCLHSMFSGSNSAHYFVATQDPDLSKKIREHPGVPLLYVKYNAIILEKPSMMSNEVARLKTEQKLKVDDYSSKVIKELKRKTFGEPAVFKKKKRKAKGPNPLSCKKKKKKVIKSQGQKKVQESQGQERVQESQGQERVQESQGQERVQESQGQEGVQESRGQEKVRKRQRRKRNKKHNISESNL